MYRDLLIGCGAKRVKDLTLPTATEIRYVMAGSTRSSKERTGTEFVNLVTLDNNIDHLPDLWGDLNLNSFGAPRMLEVRHGGGPLTPDEFCDITFPDLKARYINHDIFDEIHAYEVLEHCGRQGDYRTFFAQFTEFARILKPGGFFFATVPSIHSPWAWGDPSHTRVIPPETLVFLSQEEYTKQVGVTAMSDFRSIYKANFSVVMSDDDGNNHRFVLQAHK
jgi:SAM-dependent methyltransferase